MPGKKSIIWVVIIIILIGGLGYSIFYNTKLNTKIKNLKNENSKLSAKVKELDTTLEKKNKKIKSDREMYTKLGSRLHKKKMKVEELKQKLEELKK